VGVGARVGRIDPVRAWPSTSTSGDVARKANGRSTKAPSCGMVSSLHTKHRRQQVAQRIRVESGPYDSTFDFAVFNGRVVQLVHCWSFQLPDQAALAEEVKAWAWVVNELRRRGGNLRLGDRSVSVDLEVEVASVYIPPHADQTEMRAFEEAEAAFAETRVQRYLPEQADQLAHNAVSRLRRAQIP
jgi:hypothetical protein